MADFELRICASHLLTPLTPTLSVLSSHVYSVKGRAPRWRDVADAHLARPAYERRAGQAALPLELAALVQREAPSASKRRPPQALAEEEGEERGENAGAQVKGWEQQGEGFSEGEEEDDRPADVRRDSVAYDTCGTFARTSISVYRTSVRC